MEVRKHLESVACAIRIPTNTMLPARHARCNIELTFLLPCTACNVPHSPAVLKRQTASPFRDVPSTRGLCHDENNENRLRDLILICPVRSNCDFTSRITCEKTNHRINLGPMSIISAYTYTRPTLFSSSKYFPIFCWTLLGLSENREEYRASCFIF